MGLGNFAEVRSPLPMPSAADRASHRAAGPPPKQAVGKPSNLSRDGDEPPRKKSCTSGKPNSVKEMERNMLEEMPCVSAKGDGPNGRRIEGFLYKYRKGEEVRIVCVCHGSFLTPAEFVKHAGGGDVAHPLRHIVVNPTPSAFL